MSESLTSASVAGDQAGRPSVLSTSTAVTPVLKSGLAPLCYAGGTEVSQETRLRIVKCFGVLTQKAVAMFNSVWSAS